MCLVGTEQPGGHVVGAGKTRRGEEEGLRRRV